MTYKIIKNKNKSIFYEILHELRCLVYFYLGERPPKTVIKDQNQKDLHDKLILLAKKDRKLFGRFFDASQCIPSLHSLSHFSKKFVKNYKNIQIAQWPKLRLDLPEKKQVHNDPWHQEGWFYDSPRDSLVLWFPLVEMDKSLGRLAMKQNSNKLNLLKYTVTKKRPYMKLFKNPKWTKLKTITPKVNFGDCLLFNYAVLHKSSKNISNKVRISIQVRFNFLDNKLYNFNNYRITTPKFVSRHQEGDDFEKNRFFKF